MRVCACGRAHDARVRVRVGVRVRAWVCAYGCALQRGCGRGRAVPSLPLRQPQRCVPIGQPAQDAGRWDHPWGHTGHKPIGERHRNPGGNLDNLTRGAACVWAIPASDHVAGSNVLGTE